MTLGSHEKARCVSLLCLNIYFYNWAMRTLHFVVCDVLTSWIISHEISIRSQGSYGICSLFIYLTFCKSTMSSIQSWEHEPFSPCRTNRKNLKNRQTVLALNWSNNVNAGPSAVCIQYMPRRVRLVAAAHAGLSIGPSYVNYYLRGIA